MVIELGWVVVTVSSCIRKVGGKTGEVTLLDVIRKVGDRGPSDNPYNILCAYEEGGDSDNHEKDSEPEEREDEGE